LQAFAGGEGQMIVRQVLIFAIILDADLKSAHIHRCLVPKEGTSAVVTNVGTRCDGRGSVVARFWRADERRSCVR
jgi:hypothetical protein